MSPQQVDQKQKSRLSRLLASRRTQFIAVIALVTVCGSIFLWHSFAEESLPSDGNEVVLQYSKEVPTVLARSDDNVLSVIQASYQTQVTSDGSVYCEANQALKTGKISHSLLRKTLDETQGTGVTTIDQAKEVSGAQTQVNNFSSILITVNDTPKLITALPNAQQPAAFTKAITKINKICENATTQISPVIKPTLKQPTLPKSNNKILSAFLNKISPKVSAETAGQSGSAETDQVNSINYTRAANGRGQLPEVDCLTRAARHWAYQQAAENNMHDPPDLASYVNSYCGAAWQALGSNAGVNWGDNSPLLFSAFMASPPHAANVLDTKWDRMGVGAWAREDNSLWVSHIFARCVGCGGGWATPATPVVPPPPPTTIIGSLDSATCTLVKGWVIDRASWNTSAIVHVYYSNLDGSGSQGFVYGPTNVARKDVNAFFGGIGGNHGFQQAVPAAWRSKSAFTVRVYGIDNKSNPLVGTANVTGCGLRGALDTNPCSQITGWAFNYYDTSKATTVDIYIKNANDTNNTSRIGYRVGATNVKRTDVNDIFGITGKHGFSWAVPATWVHKPHIVEVYGIGQANIGQPNALLTTKLINCK